MRISSSPIHDTCDSFSLNEHRNKYNTISESHNQYLHYDSDTLYNNKVF